MHYVGVSEVEAIEVDVANGAVSDDMSHGVLDNL
jgi:hypothetical protein